MSAPHVPMKQQAMALLALTAVSTCIGVTMKLSQDGTGKYNYSPLSAIVMTEMFKLVASLIVVGGLLLKGSRERQTTLLAQARTFAEENYSLPLLKHVIGLSLAYSVVNFVTFGIMIHASASTFFLLKAASPVLTALILRCTVARPIASIQWLSVSMQCVGLLVAQYDSCSKSGAVSLFGYSLIVINIVVSCIAGVWNENVIKTYGTSVNAQNALLYSCGVALNLALYAIVPPSVTGLQGENVPQSFFAGYNWRVVMVIIANGSVGLVITAVYRYADVVVKTFGLAGSTTTLYMFESLGLLPSKKAVTPVATVSGAAVVFYAAYLYMAPPLMQPQTEAEKNASAAELGEAEGDGGSAPESKEAAKQSSAGMVAVPLSHDRRVGIVVGLAFFAALVLALDPRPCAQRIAGMI